EQVLAGVGFLRDADVHRTGRAANAAAAEAAHDAVGGDDRDEERQHRAGDGGSEQAGRVGGDRLPPEEEGDDQADQDAPERDQHSGARAVVTADGGGQFLVAQEGAAALLAGDVDERMSLAAVRTVAAARPGPAADGTDFEHASLYRGSRA